MWFKEKPGEAVVPSGDKASREVESFGTCDGRYRKHPALIWGSKFSDELEATLLRRAPRAPGEHLTLGSDLTHGATVRSAAGPGFLLPEVSNRIFLRTGHFGLSVKDGTFPYHQAGGPDRAGDLARSQQLHPLRRGNVPLDVTADLQGPDLYLPVHPPALTNNEYLAADDFPLQVTIHADGAAEAELALQLDPFPQESANLAEVNGEWTAAVGSSPLLLYRLDPLPAFPLPPVQYDLNIFVVREISH